jgi:1,2-diacylglycerol 3-beta-galactosyltransferase
MFDAGGGHRAAARAIAAAAEGAGVGWRTRIESLQEVLAPADASRRLTGRSLEDTYNAMVRRQQTRFLVPLLRGFQWFLGRLERRLAALIAERLRQIRPRAVVSVVPNLNGVIGRGVREGAPHAPFIVVMTDLADFPPRFWIHGDPDAVVVPSERAEAQARAVGLLPARIWRASGLALHPRFYAVDPASARTRIRREMGIPERALTVLVMFGGKGSPEIEPLTARLVAAAPDHHVIAICGDNPRLYDALAVLEQASSGRVHRLGFTDRVPELLAASDLLLSKPGPGALSEAFHLGVPVVVACNGYTIPQERYNARFLERHGLGVVVRHWREMADAVSVLAANGDRMTRLRDAVRALPSNRGVFEIVARIDQAVRPTEPAQGLALEA